MWTFLTPTPREQASRGPNERHGVRSAQVRRAGLHAAAERTARASVAARLEPSRKTALRAHVPVGEALLVSPRQRSHRGQPFTSGRRGSKWNLRHAASSQHAVTACARRRLASATRG